MKTFQEKAVEKFGDKFNLSKVNYVNCNTEVCITCKEHGDFYITPLKFLQSKHGCPECRKVSVRSRCRKTNETFIKECKEIYGDKYTYEKTDYKSADEKVIVTCKIHGDFLTRPADFIRKHGCPKCKGDKTKSENLKKRDLKEDFVTKAKALYGNLFSYENTIYINSRIKVLIHSNLCDEDFLAFPSTFLCGSVKKKYLGQDPKELISLNKEAFIQRAELIHGDKYDYSKVNYTNISTKVCIICKKHGEFWQTPVDHLWNIQGCPKCQQSKGETIVKSTLNSMKLLFEQQFKIKYLNKTMYIDFMYKYKDKIIFIEYNGRQHYSPVPMFGGEEQYKKQVERDNLLKEYCKENNIFLIEYPYTIKLVDLPDIIKGDIKRICQD